MIIGGQAVLLYGEPRLTRDIDITLGIGIQDIPKILALSKSLKLKILPENPAEFTRKTWVLPVQDEKSKIRIDFIFSFTPFEQQAIKRAKEIKIGKAKVKFASPEDLIIHKMFAGRPRDFEDISSILAKQKKLNLNYIENWLKEFDKLSPKKSLLKSFRECLKSSR